VVGDLVVVPAGPDPEQESPVREQVQAGDGAGGRDRVALDHQADAGAELDAGGGRGDCGERDERVEGVLVLLRQRAAAGPRRAHRGRDVGVLGEPVRLEAARLDLAAQFDYVHRVVGREHRHAELHRHPSAAVAVVG
jgi:hypothetical protein